MKNYYLYATGQPNDRAVYYTGKEGFHGGELWSGVEEAYRFESLADICNFIAKRGCHCESPIIVEIADVTLERCVQGSADFWKHIQSTASKVWRKYNTVSYITNARL